MDEYSAQVWLSKEHIDRLLEKGVFDDDPALTKTLKDHQARYNEDRWPTSRVRFAKWSTDNGVEMLKWCNELMGDRNRIDRRWFVAVDRKTNYYRHFTIAFRHPADQTHFVIKWHDKLFDPKRKT